MEQILPGRALLRAAFFLAAVAEIEPKVLESLRKDVFPVYSATMDQVKAREADPQLCEQARADYEERHKKPIEICESVHEAQSWECIGLTGDDGSVYWFPDFEPLKIALAEWGGNFFLDFEWVYEAALSQLRAWECHPNAEG